MPCICKEEVKSDFSKHRRRCSALCKLHVLPKRCVTQIFQPEAPCQEADHFYCLHNLLTICFCNIPYLSDFCDFFNIYLLVKKIGCICVGVCAWENGCLQRPEASDPLHLKFQVTVIWIWDLNLSPLQEQFMLLTTSSCLQPYGFYIFILVYFSGVIEVDMCSFIEYWYLESPFESILLQDFHQ